MTRRKLRSYRDILFGIDNLRNRTVDSVKASHKEYPYTRYCATVSGQLPASLNTLVKIAELQQQKREIETFIFNLPNYHLQQIAQMYANGESWSTIAAKTNCKSPDSARMQLKRFLKKDK